MIIPKHLKRWQWWVSFVILLLPILLTAGLKFIAEMLMFIGSIGGGIDPCNIDANKKITKIVDWGLGTYDD